VENPQYKMSGYGDEQVTLGVGPTVSFYRAMLRRARWCHSISSVRPPV